MPCPFQWLVITDGTTSDAGIRNQVDLVDEFGFCVLEDGDWRPAITEPKGGGVWKDSQLADGRRPADFKMQNVVESMTLTVSDQDQDALIRDTQELRRLLTKARTYGATDWQDEPVWIEAQSPGESEMRYAVIWDYRTPNDGNPYEQPFWSNVASSGMNDFVLTLEREPYWRADQPGTGTAVAISAVEAYDGRNLGNVDSAGTRDPTTADEVYLANKRNVANLTDIYHFRAAFSANLMDAALPFAFLPAVPAVGDQVLFGIDILVADSGPFASLVFDIGTAITNVTTIAWEYWNGAWVALTVQDNTDADGAMTGVAFDTTGVKSVHWVQPSDWTNVIVNAIDAFWVRARVTAIGVGPTAPTQQNRDIYSIVWPYVEISSTAVLGDVAATLQTIIKNQSDTDALLPVAAWANRAIFGLRSQSRGSAFTAYINFADEQNPAGVTIALGGTSAFAADVASPTGRVIVDTPTPPAAFAASISFASTISTEYTGAYHGFLRYQITSGTPTNLEIQVFGRYAAFAEFYRSPIHIPANTNPFQVFDLGRVDIPTTFNGHTPNILGFTVDIAGDNVAVIKLYDFILIPVDEWAIDVSDYTNATIVSRLGNRGGGAVDQRHLDIDPITSPKELVSLLKIVDDSYLMNYLTVTGASPMLQANADQRLWFFCTRLPSTGSTEERSELTISNSIQLNHVARYFSLRGNR